MADKHVLYLQSTASTHRLGVVDHGVLGSAVPAGSPLANDGIVAGSRYRVRLATLPAAGTLWMENDSSFTWPQVGESVPDGAYSATYDADEDGAAFVTGDAIALTMGGAAQDLAASGDALSVGSAALSADVSVAAVAVAVAGGSAQAVADVSLSAVGLAIAGGSASLDGGSVGDLGAAGGGDAAGSAPMSAVVTISAAGLAQAAATAGLSADVLLSGAAAALGGAINEIYTGSTKKTA